MYLFSISRLLTNGSTIINNIHCTERNLRFLRSAVYLSRYKEWSRYL